MKLIRVPHYNQGGNSDCQAACAAMVIDYWRQQDSGCDATRLRQLLKDFSFGFRPESGEVPPAITGLVALAIARSGLSVDFNSNNPDGGGVVGLDFLKDGWNFTQDDVIKYAEKATSLLADTKASRLSIHRGQMREDVIEAAIAAERPVVVIVELKILKSRRKKANHAVVITGIDDDVVAIHDPADPTPHKEYPRELFFEAHRQAATDSDAYVVTRIYPLTTAFKYECWELDGHILANIRGKEYIIDTGSPSSYLANDSLMLGDRVYTGCAPPKKLLEILCRNVSPRIAGLIGLDVLSNYDVHISLGDRVIEFHSESFTLTEGTELPLVLGTDEVPHLEVLRANGDTIDAILDLGARFSYLSISDADNTFGSAWDFWPIKPDSERFTVQLYIEDLMIAEHRCSFTAADRNVLSELQDVELIGSEILKHFDINIALRRDLIEFQPVPGCVMPART